VGSYVNELYLVIMLLRHVYRTKIFTNEFVFYFQHIYIFGLDKTFFLVKFTVNELKENFKNKSTWQMSSS